MPGAHIQKQDSLRLSCFCLILAHPSTTRSAEFTSGITRYLNQLWFWRCGEKTWAPDAANYKIDLASLLSFSSDLVSEVYARGHIWVSRVSLYGLRKRFREEVFVFKCSWGEMQLSKIYENKQSYEYMKIIHVNCGKGFPQVARQLFGNFWYFKQLFAFCAISLVIF